MMNYQGFWHGFIILFGVLPVIIGACIGMFWGWRNGLRGTKLIAATSLGAISVGFIVFAGAVLYFRA